MQVASAIPVVLVRVGATTRSNIYIPLYVIGGIVMQTDSSSSQNSTYIQAWPAKKPLIRLRAYLSNDSEPLQTEHVLAIS